MKKSLMLSLLAAPFLLTGCIDDTFLITNDQTMGNIVDGRFISDQGIWYDVTDEVNPGDTEKLLKEKRALVLCDVLENTSRNGEPSYGVLLKEFVHVDIAPIVGGIPDEEAPVLVDLAWASGSYLNFRLIYLAPEPETQEHSFSVVVEKEPTDLQEIVLHLYHHAGGEYYGAPAHEGESEKITYKQHVAFVSVEILPYYMTGAILNMRYTVKYSWHKKAEDGKTYLPETQIYEEEGKLTY